MRAVFFLMMLIMGTTVLSQTIRTAESAKGLQVGTKAPVFTAIDADNSKFVLDDALKSGPVVLIFYRGYWCPFCNKHLGQVQDSLKLITEKGAAVIAISPQKPEYLGKMAEKTKAEFTLLYDEGYKIADAYDVTFTPESKQLFVYNVMLNAKLKKTQSDDTQRLPIPATYIISQDGKIVWRQFNPDYKQRSSVIEILNHLPEN